MRRTKKNNCGKEQPKEQNKKNGEERKKYIKKGHENILNTVYKGYWIKTKETERNVINTEY